MNKAKYEIYVMSMIELMIHNNSQTDLGNYVFEYTHSFDNVGEGDMRTGDACLAVAVRLRNKTSNSIEWGNIYYKRLIPNSSAFSIETREKLEKMVSEIRAKDEGEILNFILKPESKINKKPYLKSAFINPELAPFFQNLQHLDGDFSTVSLGGKLPKDVVSHLEDTFNDTIGGIQSSSGQRTMK